MGPADWCGLCIGILIGNCRAHFSLEVLAMAKEEERLERCYDIAYTFLCNKHRDAGVLSTEVQGALTVTAAILACKLYEEGVGQVVGELGIQT